MRKKGPRGRKGGARSVIQRKHAAGRARARLGITIGKKETQDIIRSIQSGKAKFLRKRSNRVSTFEVTVRDDPVIVVYDRIRKTIVTFLTTEMYYGRKK